MQRPIRRGGRGTTQKLTNWLRLGLVAGVLLLGPVGCAGHDQSQPGFFDGVVSWFANLTNSDEGEWYLDRNLAGFRAYPLIERALRRMNEGEFDQARELMNRALRIAPRSAAAWTISGDLELRRGNIMTAEEHLNYALYLDPDLPQAHLYLGYVLIEYGAYEEARAELQYAIDSGLLTEEQMIIAANGINTATGGVGTENMEAQLNLADAALARGDAGEAVRLYLEVANANGYPEQRATALRAVAQIYRQIEYYPEAVETLLRLSELTELTPADRRMLIHNARQAGRLDVLEGQLQWMIYDGAPGERARAALELARLQADRGDVAGAQATLQAAIDDPELIEAERILLRAELANVGRPVSEPTTTTSTPPRREPTVEDLVAQFDARTPVQTTGDRAYELAARGDCAAAGPLFLQAFNQTRDPALLIARADCFNNQGDVAAAIAAFEDVRVRASMSVDNEVYVLSSLGYLYEGQGRYRPAAEAWEGALALNNDPEYRLALARNYVAQEQMDAAADLLAELNPETLSLSQRAGFYDLRASVRSTQNPQAAIEDLRAAVAAEETVDRHLRLGVLLQGEGNHREALIHMRRAYELDPRNPELAISLAYALGNVGRDGESIPYFREGIAADEERFYAAREDMAYAQLRLRRFNDAEQSFRGVVDSERRYPQETATDRRELDQRMYRVRSEIRELDRTWYLYGSAVYRSSDINSSGVPGNDRDQSQVGAEIGWYPLRGRINWGRGLSVFARAYESFEPGSIELRDESAQAGLGLRLQPFESIQLVLTAERLISIGDQARDAWQFSAAHSWGIGGDWRPGTPRWTTASTYLETAYIAEEPTFFSVNGEANLGQAVSIAPRLAVIPHAVAAVRYGEDEFVQNFLAELGIGVSFRYRFDDDRYHAPRGTADLQFQYRWYAYEDTAIPLEDDGTFLTRLVITR